MADECTLKRWAGDCALEAAKYIYRGDYVWARREMNNASEYLERAAKLQDERESAASAARPDLADAA